MTEERTEKASQQKLRRAKQKGQVAKSPFLASALVYVGGLLLIKVLFGGVFQKSFSAMFALLANSELEGAFGAVARPVVVPVVLALVGIWCVAIGAHLFQSGWMWAPEQITPKWRKKQRKIRLVLPLLQLVVIGGVGCVAIRTYEKNLFIVALVIGALLLLLGIGDYFYQRWRFAQAMRMTPQEKKDEKRG